MMPVGCGHAIRETMVMGLVGGWVAYANVDGLTTAAGTNHSDC